MKLRVAGLGLLVFVLGFGGVLHVGSELARPMHHSVGPAPSDPPMEEVSFPSRSGATIRGWFARGRPAKGGVVLLHGVRADRTSMLGRARFLHANGYSVLLVDLQAHGESEGERITFGYLEARDARAAIEFMRTRLPGEPIGALGTSMGGAACLLGDDPLPVEAMILEEVYPDIERAIENRLRVRFGTLGAWLTPLLTLQIERRLGIDPGRLRPIDRIPDVVAPLLVLAGGGDRRTTLDESRALFAAAPDPKELWVVPGAGHVDLQRYAKEDYEARVLDFLARHMHTDVRARR